MRIEVLGDPSLPRGGPGRDAEGNFFLSAFDVDAAPSNKPEAKQHIVWKEAVADESQEGYSVSKVVKDPEGERQPGWAIDASSGSARRQAVFIPDKPFGFPGGTILTIRLKHEMRKASRNIGRFRLSVSNMPDPEFVVNCRLGFVQCLKLLPTSVHRSRPKNWLQHIERFRRCWTKRASRWRHSRENWTN